MIFLCSSGEDLVKRNCVLILPTFRTAKAILIFFLAIGFLFSSPAFSQTHQPNSEPKKIRGTVVNAITHQPVGRALVSSSDNRFATLTDGGGNFEFTLPKLENDGTAAAADPVGINSPSWLWLTARKPGYVDDPKGGRQIRANPDSELTISLMPEAVIKGRVTLVTNESAIGVDVRIFSRQVQQGTPRWTPRTSVRANSNGEFRFAELTAGEYKIVTQELMDNDPVTREPNGPLFGFPPGYYPGAADFAPANTIKIAAGETFEADISLVRRPYYPVTIPVANAEANSGMNVNVSLQGNRSPGYSLGYNAAKQRIEGSLPDGNYVVEATTFGPQAATGVVNLVVAGATTEGPTLVFARNSSVSLSVKEEFAATESNGSASLSNGKHTFNLQGPRLYLQVSAESADDFVHKRASLRQPSGPNDPLVLEDLPPGRYWLRLHTSRGYVAAATMGATDLLHQPLVVGLGSASIEITMRDDGAEVEGTVAEVSPGSALEESSGFENSTQAAYLYWIPLPDSPGQFAEGAASPEGKFSSQTLAPGTYRVLAFKARQPNLPYRDAEAMRAYENKGQVVHFSAGQKANIQVQLISSE